MEKSNRAGDILITSLLVATIFALCTVILFSCVSNKKEEPKTYSLREVEGEPVPFHETWSFVIQWHENEYSLDFPITDLCYYYCDINCYGELIDVPKRSKLKTNPGTRVHFGMCCQSTSLTHFVISPEFGIREKIINDIVKAAKDFDGIQLDFEYVPRRDRALYLDFVKLVRQTMTKQNPNQILSVCVPGRLKISASDLYPYKELSEICDRVFVMAYDEHWATSEPGPIASTEWSANVADFAITQIPQEKLIMGIPLYGRTWTDKSTSKAWYFGKLKDNMTENGVAEVSYENEIPTFTYKTEVQVTGYFNDNYSLVNLCRLYKDKNVANIGFWRIGFEDPDFWNWIEIEK